MGKDIMTENGQLLAAAFESMGVLCKILANTMFGRGKQKFRTGTPTIGNDSKKDLEFLSQLVEEGKLKVVTDTKFPLAKIADAFALVHSGHKQGNCEVTEKAITEGSARGSRSSYLSLPSKLHQC